MQPDSYAGEGGPEGSFQGCVAMVQRAIATLDVAESPQLLASRGQEPSSWAGEYEERAVADVGSPRVGRTPDPDLRLRSRSRSRSKGLDVWFGGRERIEWACVRGRHAQEGGRSEKSEVRGQAREGADGAGSHR